MVRKSLNTKPGDPGFFSVSVVLLINGVKYRPAVCYPVTKLLQDTVDNLVAKQLATKYTEEHTFVNGIAMSKTQLTAKVQRGSMLTPASIEALHSDTTITVGADAQHSSEDEDQL